MNIDLIDLIQVFDFFEWNKIKINLQYFDILGKITLISYDSMKYST